MKFSASIALFLAALTSAVPLEDTVYERDAKPDPNKISVKDIRYNGSGCPVGSVDKSFNDQKDIFTLTFNKYEANVGPNVALRSDARKNCQLTLSLYYPPGFRFNVAGFITRGYADIDEGVTAEIGSIYYFSGQSQQTAARNSIPGPYHGSYTKEDKVNVATAVYSPCGVEGMANINTDIRLIANDRSKAGSLTVDSIDGKFVTKISYRLNWERCAGSDAPPPPPSDGWSDFRAVDSGLSLE